jgi:Uma2 family endonuclease
MNTFALDGEFVHIPGWVEDLASFRRWFQSDEFPEIGRICYLNGEVWVDMSKEQIFSHNQVKNEYAFVLTGLAKASRRGRFFPDGVLLTHEEADLSSQPDGTFISYESLETGRVRLVEGVQEGYVEIDGTPDMVLEVVSTSSMEKDTITQLDLYWRAGIREYWLVDVRGERLEFDIWRHTPTGYVPIRKQRGWVKSTVFGKSFRLTRQNDERGDPEYTLAVR